MVTKSKNTAEKKGKVKVTKLKLKKEAVKDLSADEQKQVKGGAVFADPPPAGDESAPRGSAAVACL